MCLLSIAIIQCRTVGNNDGNGCVLSAKYAAGAQYDRRPTMLIIPGTLSLRYIFQRLVFSRRLGMYVFQRSARAKMSRAPKISQKVKASRISSRIRSYFKYTYSSLERVRR